RRLPGGVDVEWDRDVAGRSRSRRVFQRPPAPAFGPPSGDVREISASTYQWRGDAQIAAIVDASAGPRFFAHDARGRLVTERRPGAVIERALDPAGNVVRTSAGGDRRYRAGGVLEEGEGVRYEYDADGNQTARVDATGAAWRYLWNGHGAL